MVHPINKPKTNVLEDPGLPLGAVLRVTLKFRARAIESDDLLLRQFTRALNNALNQIGE